MDFRLAQDIRLCFANWEPYGTPETAYELVNANSNNIDFDDEDDIKHFFDILEKALTYETPDGKPAGEVGVKFLEFLMEKGFDLNFTISGRQTLILKLAETCIRPEIFQKVVDLGADVYAETSGGGNVLTRSAKQVFTDWTKMDCEKSERLPVYIAEHFDMSCLDRPDEYGITPLIYAVMKNKQNLVDTLLKSGADVNATGGQFAGGCSYWMKMYGVSAFAVACREANVEMAEKLLAAGADETLCDAEGTPALFSLVYMPFNYRDKNVPQQINMSERKGKIAAMLKNPDFADSKGNTLLMKAIYKYDYGREKQTSPFNNEGVMNALLERGVNVNAANNDGKRALHFAAECWSGIIKGLLNAGADINAQDNDGNTALIILCKCGSEKEARLLLRKGADYNIKNKQGKSAADIAAEKGLTGVLELMI